MKKNILELIIKTSLIILILAMTFSCKKVPFSNGEIVNETRTLSEFKEIHLYDNIDVKLIKSDYYKIEIVTCENLMNNIISDVKDSVLTLRNDNSCNWIRSYDYPLTANIYYDSHISKIYYESVGDLSSDDYIINDSTSHFDMLVYDGGGKIDLDINCKTLFLHCNGGSTEVSLRGECKKSNIRQDSYAPIYVDDLMTDTITAVNIGCNNLYLNCRNFLNAYLYSYGSIYYKGHPEIKSFVSPNAQGRILEFKNP